MSRERTARALRRGEICRRCAGGVVRMPRAKVANPMRTSPTLPSREPARLPPRLALAALLFTLLTIWLLWPLSVTLSRRLYDPNTFPPAFLNLPDVPLTGWILAWNAHAVGAGNLRGIFDANAFHPEPLALAYSEHMLGTLPVFAPVYWLTGRLTLSYNVMVISTFIFSALAAYWAALRWLGSYGAAALVGGVYAFAPYRIYELTHIQLLR